MEWPNEPRRFIRKRSILNARTQSERNSQSSKIEMQERPRRDLRQQKSAQSFNESVFDCGCSRIVKIPTCSVRGRQQKNLILNNFFCPRYMANSREVPGVTKFPFIYIYIYLLVNLLLLFSNLDYKLILL